MGENSFKEQLLKRSYKFSLAVIKVAGELKKDQWFSLADQLLRSATSIGANIAEAQGASSRREFKNFLHHAFKSSWETRYWLGLINESDLIPSQKINLLLKECQELNKILSSILLSLKGKKKFLTLN